MRLLSLKLFLLFIYLLFPSITSADQKLDIKNLKIHKEPKKVSIMSEFRGYNYFSRNFKGKLVVINFWATWCVHVERRCHL